MIETTNCETVYRGGESAGVFPIPFPFLENSHIRAVRAGADGVGQALVQGVDYVINLVSDRNGELILLGDDLGEDETLTIGRSVPLTQENLFHNQGSNAPKTMEESLDKLTMIGQQLSHRVERALLAPPGTIPDETVAQLLAAAALASSLGARVGALDVQINGMDTLVAGLNSHTQQLLARTADLEQASATHVVSNDPRLFDRRTPVDHAPTHAMSGNDRIRPEDIGALGHPPGDGKPYLVSARGYIEYLGDNSGSEGGETGTTDHALLLNRDAPDQHPQSAICNLEGDLAALRSDVASLETGIEQISFDLEDKAQANHGHTIAAVEGLSAALSAKAESDHTHGQEEVEGLTTDLAARAPLASPAFSGSPTAPTPAAGDDSDRIATTSFVQANKSSGGYEVGTIMLRGERTGGLPAGWYFANGDRFELASPQGAALNGLATNFKSDWGIAVSGSTISLPKLFHSDGRGVFLRAVNGSARQTGSVEDDQMRAITGSISNPSGVSFASPSGAFYSSVGGSYYLNASNGGSQPRLYMDSSRLGTNYAGSDTHPINMGMIPAIYLGV